MKRVLLAALRFYKAQISPALGDVERNAAKHYEYIERAAAQGVDLLLFPEASLTGYYLQDLTDDVALPCDAPLLHHGSRRVLVYLRVPR